MASFTFEEAIQNPVPQNGGGNSFTFEEVMQPSPGTSGFNKQMQDRGARFANIMQGANGYGQSALQSLAQGGGNLVGTGADVFGKGLELGYKGFKATAPDYVQRGLTSTEDAIGSTLSPYLQKYSENLAAHQKQNPRAAANFEAIRELSNLLPLKLSPVRGTLAEMGRPIESAIKSVASDASNIPNMINTKKVYPTTEEVKNASRNLFKEATEAGGNFSTNVINDVVKIGEDLLPKDEVGKSVIIPDEADNYTVRLKKQTGKNLTLDDFESIDRDLGAKAHAAFLNDPELSRKYSELQGALRESVENPSNVVGTDKGIKAQREAVRLWSISAKMNDIDRVIKDAKYYDKPDAAIKTGFRRIARNDRLMRGYSKSERKAIERAATTGQLEGITKTFGSRLMGIIGASTGGVPGAAIGYGASEIGRGLTMAAKKGQAGSVLRQLGERSNLVRTEKRFKNKKEY